MQHDNYIQPACRNASLNANALNKYEITFKFQNVPEYFQHLGYAVYSSARYHGYQYNQEEYAGVKNEPGQIAFTFELSEDLSNFNASLETPYFNSQFENVGLHRHFRPLFVQHPAYNQLNYYSPGYFDTKTYGKSLVFLF